MIMLLNVYTCREYDDHHDYGDHERPDYSDLRKRLRTRVT